ncbi:MAG: DUF222 domain-containing protein, partial [Pseudonocardiaceae bacterium]
MDGGSEPLESLDADAVLDEIVACERVVAAAQARQMRALARFAELRSDRRAGSVDEFAADEIAPLLRISHNAAHTRLGLAIELTTRLPGTVRALANADIDLYKARIIAEHTRPLSDQQAVWVEQHVLPKAVEQTPGQLRAALRRAVLRADPHGAERRRLERIRERVVMLHPREDGTADVCAYNLDAADATAIYQRLDGYAHATSPGDGRTMDQRRADALVDLILDRTSHR